MRDYQHWRPDGHAYGALGYSPAAFGLLRDLIAERIGVHYGDAKQDLLLDRVAPLALGLGLSTLLDYYYLLRYDLDATQAWNDLRDRLAVPETYFWRQPEQYDALVNVLMPRLAARGGPVRIWSAACCTGEEPVGIAMALDDAGWFERLPIELVASDGSPALVERAKEGRFGERALRNLTPVKRSRYLQRDGDRWRVDPALHGRIRWTTANLLDEAEAGPLAESDVIFCRNVFIYFSDDAIRRVSHLFWERMPWGGSLFLGAAESLARLGGNFVMREVGSAFVYEKCSEVAAAGSPHPQLAKFSGGQGFSCSG